MAKVEKAEEAKSKRSGPLLDLALTLPIFVGYHLGVVFLPVRNAADVVTRELQDLAAQSMPLYFVLTLSIALAYVVPLLLLGRGKILGFERFAWMGSEGVLYALLMRLVAGYAVARLLVAVVPPEGGMGLLKAAPALSAEVQATSLAYDLGTRLTGAVMSLGAGFYEELTFRFALYGLGAPFLIFLFNVQSQARKVMLRIFWALACASAFSAWHYVGELGDTFEFQSFAFRAICGLVFTLIFQFRGFAPAVWTHALYDLWVLAF